MANLKQYEDALDDAKKCVELKPDFPRGYGRKGLASIIGSMRGREDYTKARNSTPTTNSSRRSCQAKKALLPPPQPGESMFGSPQRKSSPSSLATLLPKNISRTRLCRKAQTLPNQPAMLFGLMQSDPRFMKVFNVITGISMEDLQKAAKGGPGGRATEARRGAVQGRTCS